MRYNDPHVAFHQRTDLPTPSDLCQECVEHNHAILTPILLAAIGPTWEGPEHYARSVSPGESR